MAVPWPYGVSAERLAAAPNSLIAGLGGTYRPPAGMGVVTHLHHELVFGRVS